MPQYGNSPIYLNSTCTWRKFFWLKIGILTDDRWEHFRGPFVIICRISKAFFVNKNDKKSFDMKHHDIDNFFRTFKSEVFLIWYCVFKITKVKQKYSSSCQFTTCTRQDFYIVKCFLKIFFLDNIKNAFILPYLT